MKEILIDRDDFINQVARLAVLFGNGPEVGIAVMLAAVDESERLTGRKLTTPFDRARGNCKREPSELESLREDAARWKFVRDNLAQSRSSRMDGQDFWHFRAPYERGASIEEAVDREMKKYADLRE